jgi:hypothetical protein
MRRRRGLKLPELTSLLDTLFIVVFAALIQARASAERAAAEPAPAAEVAPEPPPPPPPDAGVVPLDEIRAATARVVSAIRNPDLILVVVSGEGHIASITRRWDERALPPGDLKIKLLRDSQDPDVRIAYRGREAREDRICALARRELGGEGDLGRAVVVITADRPLADMPYSLATGLIEDATTCLDDANGMGVLVDPGKATLP